MIFFKDEHSDDRDDVKKQKNITALRAITTNVFRAATADLVDISPV
jgi:hypothetical protein